MRLQRNVLWVWNLRVTAFFVLLIPVIDYFTGHFELPPMLLRAMWIASLTIMLLLLSLRFRSCRIELCEKNLRYRVGVLIRRTVNVRFSSVCAMRRIYTPLLRHFGLCNTLLYCEGAIFLLPPVDTAAADLLEQNIRREDSQNEKNL